MSESPVRTYERELVRRGHAAETRQRSLATVRRLLDFAGKRLWSLNKDDLTRFMASRRKTLAASTQANEVYRLRAFFAWAVEVGKIRRDPTRALPVPKSAPSPRLLLSKTDVVRLLAEASQPQAATDHARAVALRDRALLEVLYGLGLRGIEARRALVADLDRQEGTLLVRRAKGGKPERLPLPVASLPHVIAYVDEARGVLAREGHGGHLFVTDRGRAARYGSWLGKRVKRIGERAQVAVHPHALRRGVATHALREGVSAPAIQALLGHSSLAMTQTYLEADLTRLRGVVSLLERPRGGPPAGARHLLR